MGKPAARLGDMTAHGGTIAMGFPMVIIAGLPAARVGDMHVCPMVTPAPAPVPHVGGPVLPPGSPTVFIGGMPAARVGDMATCTGPPDTIVMGCPTVLIGEGPGSGGGGGGGAVAAATAGACAALTGESSSAEGSHWIEYRFVDAAGIPVTQVPYEYTCVDGHIEKGILTKDGILKRGGLPEAGNCSVTLFSVYNAQWSTKSAKVGDVVRLSAQVEGYAKGTMAVFRIWEQDVRGPDVFITEIETTVRGDRIEASWEYAYHEEEDEEAAETGQDKGYSSPEHYFVVHIEESKARSGLLAYQDWIELELKDGQGNPLANEKYRIVFASGESREGAVDNNGHARIDHVPVGGWEVVLPDIDQAIESDG